MTAHEISTSDPEWFYKQFPQHDTPEFRAHMAAVESEQAAKKVRDAANVQAYRDRPDLKFSELPFVGKKYRSRNRRSANKVTAWAVNPPATIGDGAVMGAGYAMALITMLGRGRDVASSWLGYGVTLERVIEGMADTLVTCKPCDRERHLAVIRGFCSLFECAAMVWVDGGRGSPEQALANTYADRQRTTALHDANLRDCHSRPWNIWHTKRALTQP